MSETQTSSPSAPLVVNLQYIKDLSFEVPGAPAIFTTLQAQPNVSINLDVQARRVDDSQPIFEVALVIRAEATDNGPGITSGTNGQGNGQGNSQAADEARTVFIADLAYAGLFTLSSIPPEQIEPVLLIECPRLLFPFARNILADITREGGFPPVLLQPIDFVALWHSRRGQGETANPV